MVENPGRPVDHRHHERLECRLGVGGAVGEFGDALRIGDDVELETAPRGSGRHIGQRLVTVAGQDEHRSVAGPIVGFEAVVGVVRSDRPLEHGGSLPAARRRFVGRSDIHGGHGEGCWRLGC